MRGRVFLFLLTTVITLSGLSQPTLLRPLLTTPSSPTATATPLPPTVTPSPTRNYFAHVPTATPYGRGGAVVQPLPSPSLGDLPPTFTPTPPPPISSAAPTQSAAVVPSEPALLLPDPSQPAWPGPESSQAALPPERIQIPRLQLDAPIEPAAMVPSNAASNVYEWAVPDHRAAGWLTQSASLAEPGNIVLDGHHNMAGEVFRDIWTLQAGDEIRLWAGAETRLYQVTETLILPERDQPLEVRLANAQYIQPTADERLTLITCWPYEDNSHRAIVVARPVAGAQP